MNSFEIIKKTVVGNTYKLNTIGYNIQVDLAAKIFVALRDYLNDYETSVTTFNADTEVGDAIIGMATVKEFRDAGLLL